MIRWATLTITWVKVDKPTFDLVGVILGSLALSGLLAGAALALGLLFAVLLIRRDTRGSGRKTSLLGLERSGGADSAMRQHS